MKALRFIALFATALCLYFIYDQDPHSDVANHTEAPSKADLMKIKKDKPEAFAQAHNLMRTRVGDSEVRYPINYQFTAFEKARRQLAASGRSRDILPWEERGPGNVGGRTRGIVLDSRDTTFSTWFLGAVGGGIWRTGDAGETWTNLTPDFPNLGISWLVQSIDPNIFFASTGNAFVSRGTNGSGIWKSTDGGETWNVLESTQNELFQNVFRVDVSPVDPDELVAATLGRREFGFTDNVSRILKSTDGGLTWTLKHEKGGGRIQQILYADSTTLYAAVNGDGVLQSLDRGETWNYTWEPDFLHGRMELAAIGPVIYAAIDGTGGTPDAIYRSTDAGKTWFNIVNAIDGDDISGWLGGQGWFDNTIAINPANIWEIYAAGQSAVIHVITPEAPDGNLLRSVFNVVADGYNNYGLGVGSKGVHVDHHNIILRNHPETGELFILNANDGGVSYSRDRGETFRQTGDSFKDRDGTTYQTLKGYNTSQFYGVDKMNGGDRYVGGTQDNGSWVSGRNPGIDSEWRDAPSGDGFEAAWNYRDSNLLLESSQYNNIYRSMDGGFTWSNVDLPPGSGPFITRIENSKLSPNLVFVSSSNGLFRSADFGLSWRTIPMPNLWDFNSSLGPPLEISLASPRIVWSGEAMQGDSRLCVSIDGGNHFTVVNNAEIQLAGLITGIASHPFDENIAYVMFSVPESPKIMQTRDLGRTWTDLTGYNAETETHDNGYPDVATYSVLVMPYDTNIIWAGTEIGIFESTDGGKNWLYADNGFPAAPAWDMRIVNDEIVVGTHGRGIWSVTMPELADYEPVATLALPELRKEPTFGSEITGSYRLGSPFDSSRFKIIDEITGAEIVNQFIPANTDIIQEDFLQNVSEFILEDTIQRVQISLTSYVDTLVFEEVVSAEVFNKFDEVVTDYSNDFEDRKTDFARSGFFIPDFDLALGSALNTIHPYPANTEYKAIFRHPVRIANESTLTLDEIVLVEPGASTDPDNSSFWDYVEIQATDDNGASWVRLDKYDSNFDSVWLAAYDFDLDGEPSLIAEKSIDLTQFFDEGDTIFLRFRLVSDPFVEGWGWWIDNINISSASTSTVELLADGSKFNVRIFPNPISESGRIFFELPEPADTRISIVDLSGNEIKVIERARLTSGEHQYMFDRENLLAGIYLVRFQIGQQVFSEKISVF